MLNFINCLNVTGLLSICSSFADLKSRFFIALFVANKYWFEHFDFKGLAESCIQ